LGAAAGGFPGGMIIAGRSDEIPVTVALGLGVVVPSCMMLVPTNNVLAPSVAVGTIENTGVGFPVVVELIVEDSVEVEMTTEVDVSDGVLVG